MFSLKLLIVSVGIRLLHKNHITIGYRVVMGEKKDKIQQQFVY